MNFPNYEEQTLTPITFLSDDGRELLFQGVHYNVFIEGLMSKTAIEQKYMNPFHTNIEAVYTFPLISSAVLLNVEIKINDRTLKGQIVVSSEADGQYDQAMNEGNRAILVEKDSAGIYTVKVGNILPNDTITVIFEYTELLSWKQNRIKLSIPTVIAQKYGDAGQLNMGGIKQPVYSPHAENYFTFEMFVSGVLSDAQIQTPSHAMQISRTPAMTHVQLSQSAELMERDITLTFDTDKNQESRSFALCGKGVEGYAAIASFYPSFEQEYAKKPKSVTFVIDCSGSMEGISIFKAKSALAKAIEHLCEDDYVNMILFGSQSKKIFEHEVQAMDENLKILRRSIDYIDADMGGTEMENALDEAYGAKDPGLTIDRYIFLITDGEITDHMGVIKNAIMSEMSHFIVGVGYATDEALLSQIAAKTKGSFENIDPNENMDTYILNLFKKIDSPKTKEIKIQWPAQSGREIVPKVVYEGDTLYAYALFNEKPTGEVKLIYVLDNGSIHTMRTSITEVEIQKIPSSVSRIVVHEIMNAISNEKQITQYSLQYQLFSQYTKYILTDEVSDEMKPFLRPMIHQVNVRVHRAGIAGSNHSAEFLDVPTFMRTPTEKLIEDGDVEKVLAMVERLPGYYVEIATLMLNHWYVNSGKVRLPDSVRELRGIGITRKEIIDLLKDAILAVFIEALVQRFILEFDLNVLDEDFMMEVL